MLRREWWRDASSACGWRQTPEARRVRLAASHCHSRKEQTVSTQAPASSARDVVRQVAPKLIELSEKVLFGDVWERPGLSKRDRSLITVAALTAMYRTDQLPGHLERALTNGVTREEIGEIITHLAFYAGWPAAMTAGTIARRVFDARKP
ncbi:MAG: carboxymuconolactone decarboxylase family protein [Candidatus Rokuibacteriota bacterium]|nr:MAG: carboxymuconolactone decarboxylase family protein [Candidatus Rokubacteria bacterium]PYO05234.1 MAG: carboxymuconolactone decarboxylase family protein [Candidatus Rokubacteria bacterium]